MTAVALVIVPTIVFLSDSPPTSDEVAVLRSGVKLVQQSAKDHDWEVSIHGDMAWVRPADFWSMRSFSFKLKGFEALSTMDLRSGNALVLGKLPEDRANGLRMMLERSSHAQLFTQAMKRDTFPVAVDTVRTLTLSDGKRTVEFRLPGLSATKGSEYVPADEVSSDPSPGPQTHPKPKPTMVFSFFGPASSSDRVKAASAFAATVAETLAQQNLAYEQAKATLASKLTFRGPGVGGKLAADPELYRSLTEQVQSNPGLHGFSDGNAGRTFLDSARVSATKDNVFVGCRLYGPAGTPTMTFVNADIARFSP